MKPVALANIQQLEAINEYYLEHPQSEKKVLVSLKKLILTFADIDPAKIAKLFSLIKSKKMSPEKIIPVLLNSENRNYFADIYFVLNNIAFTKQLLILILAQPAVCHVIKYEMIQSGKKTIDSEQIFQTLCERVISPEINNILARKGITSDFLSSTSEAKFSTNIHDHVARFFTFIYSRPFVNDGWYGEEKTKKSASRHKHDIIHVVRTAIFSYALLVLYASAEIKDEASEITKIIEEAKKILNDPESITLLMIGALLHDSGRQSNGVDHWDYDSGLIIFHYLRSLNISQEKAILVAEATANKDSEQKGYFRHLVEYAPGKFRWEKGSAPNNPFFELLNLIISDADRLDIKRVRPIFFGEQLHYYKKIACHSPASTKILGRMISEVSALINKQGDSFLRTDTQVKKIFTHEGAYQATIDEILKTDTVHPLHQLQVLSQLLKAKAPLPAIALPAAQEEDEMIMQKRLQTGVLLRGIDQPTHLVAASISKRTQQLKPPRTHVEYELDKISRLPEVKTRGEHFNKYGFSLRSCSIASDNIGTFCNAGLILWSENIVEDIKGVYENNIKSGFGKKSAIILPECKSVPEAFKQVLTSGIIGKKTGSKNIHNESVMTVKMEQVQGVFYCQELNISNRKNDFRPYHRHTPVLEALAIQQSLAKRGKNVAVWEYSNSPSSLVKQVFSTAEITQLWAEMVTEYLNTQIKTKNFACLVCDLETLKINSMYGDAKNSLPADIDYPLELKKSVDIAITSEFNKLKIKLGIIAPPTVPQLPKIDLEITVEMKECKEKIAKLKIYSESISGSRGTYSSTLFDNATSKLCYKFIKSFTESTSTVVTHQEYELFTQDLKLQAIIGPLIKQEPLTRPSASCEI